MNGAEKIVKAMKDVSKSNKQIPSEIVTVTVIGINPLIFQLENRLQITSEFYDLSNLTDWTKVQTGQVFRALSFNEGQKYYILEQYPLQGSTNSGVMDERITNNREDINLIKNAITSINNAISTLQDNISEITDTVGDIPINIYSLDEIIVGTWLDKPLYRIVIPLTSSQFGTGTATQPTQVNIAHNIANIDFAVNWNCKWKRTSNGMFYSFPIAHPASTPWQGRLNVSTTNLNFEMGATLVNLLRTDASSIYVIVEYTKTTD